MTIQIKAIEQHFQVVLLIILYKMTLTFKSVNETLVCDHSNIKAIAHKSHGTLEV